MTAIRIGIWGAGAMGTAHAAAYAGIEGAEVVGVFSRNPDRARAVATICKAEPFADADALMASVDAIDVCLPSALHRFLTLQSAFNFRFIDLLTSVTNVYVHGCFIRVNVTYYTLFEY